jgi:hypothetical protein
MFRQSQFIQSLIQLMQTFPEFSDILELLISELQKRTKEEILLRLQTLEDEDW